MKLNLHSGMFADDTRFYEVFLDGVRQDRLLVADEEAGLVVRDASGMKDVIPPGAETRSVGTRIGIVHRGEVLIRDMRTLKGEQA